MKYTRTKLAPATVVCLTLAATLPAWGQNKVAQPPWRGHLALAVSGTSRPRIAGRSLPPRRQGMPATQAFAMGVQGQDALATEEQGRDALATPGVLQEPLLLGDGPLQPVTAEHRGRLLVLTYGPKATGGLMVSPDQRREPPRFVIYRGERQIASGQFEYG